MNLFCKMFMRVQKLNICLLVKKETGHNLLKRKDSLKLNSRRKRKKIFIARCEYEKRRRANESEEFIYGKEKMCKWIFWIWNKETGDPISVPKTNKRQLQTACGCWWWKLKALKEFIRKSFLLENRTTCLPFRMSDFPQFIIIFICCVKQMKQELISWAHSSLLISIFEISKTG